MVDEAMKESLGKRSSEITRIMAAIAPCWELIVEELKHRKQSRIEQLIMSNNDEVRGRIKELDDLMLLPGELHQELNDLEPALSDGTDADQEGITAS